jgi:hypothetical protein
VPLLKGSMGRAGVNVAVRVEKTIKRQISPDVI